MTSILLAVSMGLLAPATVGDFVKGVAETRGIVRDTPAAAREALGRYGYDVPSVDSGKTLTEGDVVRIGNALGLNLATSQPTSTFDFDRMQRFLRAVGPRIAAAATSDDEHSGAGGKSKPKSKSPKKPPKPPKPGHDDH